LTSVYAGPQFARLFADLGCFALHIKSIVIGEAIETTRTPEEQQRVHVPRAFLERTIRDLNERVEGWRVELVFNITEVGISNWEG
jgi:hypothetical protein